MLAQQIVLQEHVDTVKHLKGRGEALEEEMRHAMQGLSLAPVVKRLMVLREWNSLSQLQWHINWVTSVDLSCRNELEDLICGHLILSGKM